MGHDNSSKKWHFSASGQSIGKRSSVPETRRPGLLPSINNSRNLALLKNKKIRKEKNQYDIFHMFHYVHHNFLIRCHFDEVFSESYSAGLYEHFDTKFEFFPCRITRIEFFETTECGPSGTGGTSGRIGF